MGGAKLKRAGVSDEMKSMLAKGGWRKDMVGITAHVDQIAAMHNHTRLSISAEHEHFSDDFTKDVSARQILRSIMAGSIRGGQRLFAAGAIPTDRCQRCARAAHTREDVHPEGFFTGTRTSATAMKTLSDSVGSTSTEIAWNHMSRP